MPTDSALAPVAAPREEMVAPARNTRLYWLDWVRFLAALIVLCDHVRDFTWGRIDPARMHSAGILLFAWVGNLGREAVVVFFVLSGLLVGGKLVGRVRAGTFDATSYAADRIARVYVPLIPAVLLSMAVVRMEDLMFQPWEFVGALFGVQRALTETPMINEPLWSLAYEIWAYVLAGCAAAFIQWHGSRRRRVLSGIGIAAALGIFSVLQTSYLFCWLLGVAGFWLRDRLTKNTRVPVAITGMAVAVVGSVLCQVELGILPAFPGSDVLHLLPPRTLATAEIIVAVGALLGVAGLMALPPRTPTGAWIERLGTRPAAFSYTLYLTHFPLLCLLVVNYGVLPPVFTWGSMGRAALWLAMSIVLAQGMYALFEARTGHVRRWLRARFRSGEQPTAGGAGTPRDLVPSARLSGEAAVMPSPARN